MAKNDNYFIWTITLTFTFGVIGLLSGQTAVNLGRLAPIAGIVTLTGAIGAMFGLVLGLIIDLKWS